ncbi:hypothetical protein [Sphingomonas flavalba]|uniref:hypothetical protein n=1 Tax=Sphingomonas flavalba TaxID=2559804 RepID=UPI00109DF219|nr:hypothetical protein [Sphingomonas flavalba]
MSDQKPETPPTAKDKRKWVAAGVGVGIGSAALAAALLYANQSRRKPAAKLKPSDPEEKATD